MRRLLLFVALATLVAAGCSHGVGGDSAQEILAQTSQNLGDIKSGDLALNLLFTAKGANRAGFDLEGPFQLRENEPAEAQFDYTQIAGDKTASQTFILKDGKAYVTMGGVSYELPASTANQVTATLGSSGGLSTIDLTNWVEHPDLSDGGEVGGTDTDRISGRLNVTNVLSGLVSIASQVGRTTPLAPLSGASAEQVKNAVKEATVHVYTGKDDRLLRKLDVSIDFAPAAEQVKNLLGASVRFTLEISNPNEPVTVEAPTNARPYSPGS
jgi:hypothetical protein